MGMAPTREEVREGMSDLVGENVTVSRVNEYASIYYGRLVEVDGQAGNEWGIIRGRKVTFVKLQHLVSVDVDKRHVCVIAAW